MRRSLANRRALAAPHPVPLLLRYQIVLARSDSWPGYHRTPWGRATTLVHVSASLLVRWLAKPTPIAAEFLWSPLCHSKSARTTASMRHLLRAIAVPLALPLHFAGCSQSSALRDTLQRGYRS